MSSWSAASHSEPNFQIYLDAKESIVKLVVSWLGSISCAKTGGLKGITTTYNHRGKQGEAGGNSGKGLRKTKIWVKGPWKKKQFLATGLQ